ncbi:MAG: DUF547 domain-containing protein [Hyphomicrobiales bacterium]|nr:DUF547 domain-containing protein [Hyphomicrobiales bacterium]MCP5370672.1 DUF547 domain-containing protein [Hyphomicrobiales bacterium]
MAALPLAGISSFEALFAPRADLWQRWTRHDPASSVRIDHGPWAAFLARYVRPGDDGINRVAYGQVTAADRAALEAYLSALAAVPVDGLNRDRQMAFWINLYNALTVRLILDYAPKESIRDIDISPGLFSDGPWGRKLVRVAGEDVSLNDIEHRILRPVWRDPRVHYAVNCASLGCPNLWPEPFRAGDLAAQLDAAARAYVNHPRGARVHGGKLTVSSIYVWFGGDFGGGAGVLAHLRRYAGEALLKDLAPITGIADHAYDWRLNAAGRGS